MTLEKDFEECFDRWNEIAGDQGEPTLSWSDDLGSPSDFGFPHLRVKHSTLGETYLNEVVDEFRTRKGLTAFTYPSWFPDGGQSAFAEKGAGDMRYGLLLRQLIGRRAVRSHSCVIDASGNLYRRSKCFTVEPAASVSLGFRSNTTSNGDFLPMLTQELLSEYYDLANQVVFNTAIYSVGEIEPIELGNPSLFVESAYSGALLSGVAQGVKTFSTSWFTGQTILTSNTFPTTLAALASGTPGATGKYVWFWIPDVLTKIAALSALGDPANSFMYWDMNVAQPTGLQNLCYWTGYAQPADWPYDAEVFPLNEQWSESNLVG